MIAKNKIAVYTDRYKSAYGINPRGMGYWFFHCKGKVRLDFGYTGMYKEAKKKAVEFASEHDCYIVSLQS